MGLNTKRWRPVKRNVMAPPMLHTIWPCGAAGRFSWMLVGRGRAVNTTTASSSAVADALGISTLCSNTSSGAGGVVLACRSQRMQP